jgi:hypothetical protein
MKDTRIAHLFDTTLTYFFNAEFDKVIRGGRLPIIREILNRIPNPCGYVYHILFTASQLGHAKVINYLIATGIDPSLAEKPMQI